MINLVRVSSDYIVSSSLNDNGEKLAENALLARHMHDAWVVPSLQSDLVLMILFEDIELSAI